MATGHDAIQEAAQSIRQRGGAAPVVGVVLGSGLGAFADQLEARVVVPYKDIPHFPTSSIAGHAGQLVLGAVRGVPCAVMNGRVHYYEGYDMRQVTFPMRVLKALGVTDVIVTNAAGSVNTAYRPGDFMVISDHINLTGQNPLHGPNDERMGPRFPDMTTAYGARGREALHGAARAKGLTLHEGVYVGLAGPSYETPAEIRMLRALGGDAVGMSTVAETIVAVHGGMRVAGLSVITNHAAGVGHAPLSHEEVKEVGARVQGALIGLLAEAVVRLK